MDFALVDVQQELVEQAVGTFQFEDFSGLASRRRADGASGAANGSKDEERVSCRSVQCFSFFGWGDGLKRYPNAVCGGWLFVARPSCPP